MNNYLLDYIQKVRTNKANQNLFYSSSALFSIIISIFILLGCIEFIFHLGMENRRIIFEIILFLFFGGSTYLVFNWIIQSKGLFGNYSDFEIATWIGKIKPEIADRLLNGIQLEYSKNSQNEDLVNHAVDKIKTQIEKIHFKNM